MPRTTSPCPECATHLASTGGEHYTTPHGVTVYSPTESVSYHRVRDHTGKRRKRTDHRDAIELATALDRVAAGTASLEDLEKPSQPLTVMLDRYLHPRPHLEGGALTYKADDCRCYPKLARSTKAKYESHAHNWIRPVLKAVGPCRKLDADAIRRIEERVLGAHRSDSTLAGVQGVLMPLLDWGADNGWLPQMSEIRRELKWEDRGLEETPQVQGSEKTVDDNAIPTWPLIRDLGVAIGEHVNAKRGSRYHKTTYHEDAGELYGAMPELTPATGLRCGEMLALTDKDIEFSDSNPNLARVHVRRQAGYSKGCRYRRPKRQKIRSTFCLPNYVPLLRRAVEIARQRHEAVDVIVRDQHGRVDRQASVYGAHLLFPKMTNTGEAMSANNWNAYYMVPVAFELDGWGGVEIQVTDSNGNQKYRTDGTPITKRDLHYKWHGLRHRFAVTLLVPVRDGGLGKNPLYVKEWLGHASTDTTTETYANHIEDEEEVFIRGAEDFDPLSREFRAA